ncbi:unnamed protein product [Ambrosiozyma monospora]|uniref:Unnamed protein product n=1 Tax=Ambrosiozyma monospora TaxID=43982 RepID=A0A9W6T493_AMBMO|nr:unnamed protein product [Ambrosiozyma monospora]
MPSTIVGYYNTTTKQTANYQQTSKPANYQQSNKPVNQQTSFNQQTSQPTNQSTNKPVNQQTSQPANPPTNQHQIINQIGTLDNYKQLNCMHACVFCIFTYNLQV